MSLLVSIRLLAALVVYSTGGWDVLLVGRGRTAGRVASERSEAAYRDPRVGMSCWSGGDVLLVSIRLLAALVVYSTGGGDVLLVE
ncbi:hypothetical protein [Gordonia hankookensis]|uniref:Secreted protein n=1 Tax=Gordonia hankookensis TaxID=589403 RepID=A0ABR7WBJ9_9ACTN|nr:hypothetical protein [Gordonia hankookensis]MBD1319995.1 hypothetical protein [Gordonia hankookensis]